MYEKSSARYTTTVSKLTPIMSTGKSISTKPIAQNCRLAFILPRGLGGMSLPSFPASPRSPVTINSLDISKTVIQILTRSI